MKRWIAILLVLAMLPVLPAFAAPAENAGERGSVEELWSCLNAAEEAALEERATRLPHSTVDSSTAAAVAEAAMAHPLYVPGSLRWQGSEQFTFETTAGVTCGYSVRLRNLARAAQPKAAPEIQTEHMSYAQRLSTDSKDVFVFQPYYLIDESFTQQYQQEGKEIAQALNGTYTLCTAEAATVDAIADAIEQGAVVIFDSHGETDYARGDDYTSGASTSYVLLQSGEGLTEADYADDNGVYHAVDYGHYLDMYYYAVDGTCIANHMDGSSDNGFLWMAICLGMATDGLQRPLMERGVGVVYGYSQSVTFGGDYCWEDCFWDEMIAGGTVAEAAAEMKERYGCWDYSPEIYEANGWIEDSETCYNILKARRLSVAFPVVASCHDPYPGHGKVDDLQEVRSTWQLPLPGVLRHELTARSSDEQLGSVSLAGAVITAQPVENATVSGYTLEPENAATVQWEGNAFTLSHMTADCCLTVHFERNIPAQLRYVLPEGCTVQEKEAYVGKWFVPEAAQGSPVFDAEDYQFCGWSLTEVTDSSLCPETVTEGFYPQEGENLLYGLFCYTDCGTLYYTTQLRMKICYAKAYTDVDLNAWYHDALDFVLEKGFMNGTGKNSFAPEDSLTRAMLATILYRMSGDRESRSHPFADVPREAWYAQAVAWAYETGVVNGVSADRFAPESPVTREQTAAMLFRYARAMEMDTQSRGSLDAFADRQQISAYALEPMSWAVGEEILQGKGNGILDPTGLATRAQIAKIIYAWLE